MSTAPPTIAPTLSPIHHANQAQVACASGNMPEATNVATPPLALTVMLTKTTKVYTSTSRQCIKRQSNRARRNSAAATTAHRVLPTLMPRAVHNDKPLDRLKSTAASQMAGQ